MHPRLLDVPLPPTRWTRTVQVLTRRAVRQRYRVDVIGAEFVPDTGPVILAANHMGYADGPLLFAVAPRPVHALVKSTMFVGRLGYALTQTGQISVNRRQLDLKAVKSCLRVLDSGGVVAIYPEGVRGVGDVQRTKPGAAYLALVSGAPVVPVACLGTRESGAPFDSTPVRGSRLAVVFGPPVHIAPVSWSRTRGRVAGEQAHLQEILAKHVQSACQATGFPLPALPAPTLPAPTLAGVEAPSSSR